MKKKSLGLNAFLNGIRSVLNLLFPLLTFPYVSRILGATGMGKYNFANSIVSYFLMIAALGINTYAVREGARIRDDRKKFSNFASQIFSYNVVSTVVSYVLLFFCLAIFKNLQDYKTAILIFSVQVFFTTIGIEWIYEVYEEYVYITIRSIIFKLISILLLFLLVRHQNDYLNYAAVTVFSSVGSNVLNFVHSRKICDIRLTLNIDWKKHTGPIFIIFASSIAAQVYVSSDITLLGIFKNDYVVGIYSVSSKIYNIIKNLVQAVVVVTVPRLSMLLGQRHTPEFKALLRRVTDTLALLTIPSTVGVFMLAPQIILIISGKEYLRGVSSLRLLCPALAISVFSWVFAFCILMPLKKERKFLIATIASGVLNIGLNLILIPLMSENGAAITTSLAEILMFGMMVYYCKDTINGIFNWIFWRNILSYLIGSFTIVPICIGVNAIFKSTIVQLLFATAVSVIVYGTVLLLCGNSTLKDALNSLKMRLNK